MRLDVSTQIFAQIILGRLGELASDNERRLGTFSRFFFGFGRDKWFGSQTRKRPMKKKYLTALSGYRLRLSGYSFELLT